MKRTALVSSLVLLCGLSHAADVAPVQPPVPQPGSQSSAAAISALEARIAAAGTKAAAADLLALSAAYEKAGQPVQAAGALERATKAGAATAANLSRLARLNEATARWEPAVLAYKAAVAADPKAANVADLQLRAARLMADTGDERAASTYMVALATSLAGTPTGVDVLADWRRRYFDRGEFNAERNVVADLAVAKHPGEGRLADLIGFGANRLAEGGKPADGAAALATLVKADPTAMKNGQVVYALAVIASKTGKPAEAVTKLEEYYTLTWNPGHLMWAGEWCTATDKPRAINIYLRVAKEWSHHSTGPDALLRAASLGATKAQIEPLVPRILAALNEDQSRQGQILWMFGELSGDAAMQAKAIRLGMWWIDIDVVAKTAAEKPPVRQALESVAADPQLGNMCWQARCLLGMVDAKPEAIATATREAGWYEEGRGVWWNERISRLLTASKADAATVERVYSIIATGFLPPNLRINAADYARNFLAPLKADDKIKALQDAARAPSTDPLEAAVAGEDGVMAKKMALALAPPATTPPLQQAWLRDRAEVELRNDQDTHSRFLQQAAQEGRNGPMTTWWLYWVSNRQWKTQYDAAIAAGQAMVAANHQYSVRTSLLLAWIQHNAGKSADAIATLRKTSGETPSTWSREQIAVAAYACNNVGDRAMYDLLIGEALARGDGERQFNLMWHFGPKEEWRASIWKRMVSESKDRTIQAEAYLQLGETAKVIAEYPDVLDQCERALCNQVTAARNAKNAVDEEKAVELLLSQVLTRGCANPNRASNEVWPAYDARPKADLALKKRWLQSLITIGSYHSLWAYQRLSEMTVATDPVEASKLLQNMVRTRGRNHREGFDEIFVEVKKETAAGRYGVASATFAHMAEWFNAVDEDRRAMARRASAEALAKIGGGAAATALIDDRDPNAPLLRAAALLAAGDEDEAYRQATSNPKLLDANITTLGSDLLLLIARNRIREGEFPFARDLLQRLIQARSTDKSAAETVARAHLLLGDIEFRNANYPAALLEFQAITAGWPATRAALDAGLRTGDAHLAARRDADARKAYEVLVDNEDVETRIKARFRLAMLEHRAGNEAAASERFRQVAAMNPSKALADQLYLDWGKALIEKNQLAEAESIVTLVGIGDKLDPVAPGEPVRITLRDPWLQTSQNRTSVPVIVTTDGGDREEATLVLSTDVKGLFVGRVPTALGAPVPGDRVIQVRGGERIHYDFTEDFRKGRRNLGAAGTVEIAADAELKAGSTAASAQFPGESAAGATDGTNPQRKQSLSDLLGGSGDDEAQAVTRDRAKRVRGEQVRPGGSINVAVRDADRDRTDKPDRVAALISAASGDEVQATLVESGPDTGIFRAVIASRLRPADVQVSDSATGSDPLVMLLQKNAPDFDRAERAWIGSPNGRAGKTVTGDLKRTTAVDSVTWSRGAVPPPSKDKPAPEWKPGLAGAYFAGRDFAGMPIFNSVGLPVSEDFSVPNHGNQNWCVRWSGQINIPAAGEYQFRATSDDGARIAVSGAEVLKDWGGGHGPTPVDGVIKLAAGWQPIVIEHFNGSGGGMMSVAWALKGAELKVIAAGDLRCSSDSSNMQDRRITAYRIATSIDGESWTPVFNSAGTGQALAGWLASRRYELAGKPEQRPRRTAPHAFPTIDGNQGWQMVDAVAFAPPAGAAKPANLEVASALLIPKAGRYEFALRAGGAASLQVGSEIIVDKTDEAADRPADELKWRGGLDLPAGHTRLYVEVAGTTGNTSLTLLWKAPGDKEFTVIPKEAFDRNITAEALKRFTGRDPAAAKPLADRHGATVTFPPISARFVRMTIDAWDSGDAPAVARFSIDSAGATVLPAPGIDYRKLADDDILELSPGDEVTVSYVDEVNKNGQVQTLRSRMRSTYEDGKIAFLDARTVTDEDGNLREDIFERYRFKVGERIAVRITDADLDVTDKPDRIKVKYSSANGKVEVEGVETGPATGEFIAEVMTASPDGKTADKTSEKSTEKSTEKADEKPAAKRQVLIVPPGDLVRASYMDSENNFPGQPTERTATIREAVSGSRSILIAPTAWVPQGAVPRTQPAGVPEGFSIESGAPSTEATVVPGEVTLVVSDPSALTSEASRVVVRLTSSGGAVCDVSLRPAQGVDGTFSGSLLVALGDATMPVFVLPGAGQRLSAYSLQAPLYSGQVPVMPLQGDETVTATYLAGVAATGDEAELAAARDAAAEVAGAPHATMRLAPMAQISIVRDDLEHSTSVVHVGGKLYLRLLSPALDLTPGRDRVGVQVSSSSGDAQEVALEETEGHSGLFTGSVALESGGKADPADGHFKVVFGDTIRATVKLATSKAETTVLVAKGADADVAAFARRFADELLAARTQVRLAECYFELYRSQRLNLKEQEKTGGSAADVAETKRLMAATLGEGVALLRRTLSDYPASAEQDRILYLLGQFEQESGQYDAAVDRYRTLIAAYPASNHAPEAQYKVAQCFEDLQRFDEAWEAYVRLGNRWPDHSLVADAMVHIGLFYQDRAKKVGDESEKTWRASRKFVDPNEKPPLPDAVRSDWMQAAGVYGRMVARFPDHAVADQTMLGQGNALYQAHEYVKAKAVFDAFPRNYPTSPHQPKALYWAGMSALSLSNDGLRMCYLLFMRLLQDYPESTEAKLARGLMLEDKRFLDLDAMGEIKAK